MDLKEALSGYERIESLKDIGSVAELADSLLELRAKLSSTHRGPAKDAPNEDIVRHLREVAGVKSPTDFRVDHIQDDDLRSVVDKARDAAFETGVAPDGWARITTVIAEHEANKQKSSTETRKAEFDKILQSKGEGAEGFKNAAKQALNKLVHDNPDLADKFSPDDNPDHLLLLGEIGNLTSSESTLPVGRDSETRSTSETGFVEVYEAMTDPISSYLGHEPEKLRAKKAAVVRYENLMAKHVGTDRVDEFREWLEKNRR